MAGKLTLAFVKRRARAAGDPERARHDRAYHKTPLDCWGVAGPAAKALARELRPDFLALGPAERRRLLDGLWASRVLDLRGLAILFWERLKPRDYLAEDWPRALAWAREATGWAELDGIAARLVGPLLLADPRRYRELAALAREERFWLRRLSILGHLVPFRAGQGRWDVLEPTLLALAHEKEFFIRKAIGWQLREIGDRDPERAAAFLQAHGRRLAGLSWREATRKLDPGLREKLARARESDGRGYPE